MAARRLLPALLTAVAGVAIASSPASAAEPRLTVAKATLDAALHCVGAIDNATQTPLMLVTGTGASGAEAYAIGKGALDTYGAPVCYVDFPDYTTADVQVSVQYLVNGLRVMSQRAGRPVAVFGISQGGLLPRIALTYWPSLRAQVADVISAAGTHHGSNVGGAAAAAKCARVGCVPASWQQASGSRFLRALNAQRDETPGPTSWTTVRSLTDETVQPQAGPNATSSLKGATNVLIQDICPGRAVTHIGTAIDSVTFALVVDAMTNDGPASIIRLPADVCAHPYAPGLDEAGTTALLGGADGLIGSRYASQPTVKREPKVRAVFKRRVR